MNDNTLIPRPRAEWPRLWTALPAGEVKTAAEACARALGGMDNIVDVSLPQSGLSLLKLRDAALLDAWYPGEVPLARAHVRVRASDGREVEGAAQLIDDRARLARHIAILDAVLAGRLPGWEAAAALLESGGAVREAEAGERRALLAATRVDFSPLSASEDDDE